VSLQSEVFAIRNSAGLSRSTHVAIVRADGAGALDFLQTASTQSPYMREGRVRHTLLLRDDASVLADAFIVNVDDAFLVLAEGPSEAELVAWLEQLRDRAGAKNVNVRGTSGEWTTFGVDGPYAWGRGNGFALLGVTEALTYLPANWTDRARVLEIYRKHVAALVKRQSDDGSWRQVVDEPTSYRELTVTAMTTAAMARGVRLGWIDRATYEPIVSRGWSAVASRVNADGTVKDVCSGTGVGPTKEYYLNRPVVNGADDRGGAMALLAAIEIETLRRAR